MTRKIKTITISAGWHGGKFFRVEKITDSTEFMPHQELDKTTVDSLCASQHWKVTIIPFPH